MALVTGGDLAEGGRRVQALGVRSLTGVADVRRPDQLERAVAQTASTLAA